MTAPSAIGLTAAEGLPALRSALRKSVMMAMRRGIAVALLAAAVAAFAVTLLFGFGPRVAAVVATAMLGAGGVAGLILARLHASIIARLAARPVELLLDQAKVGYGLDEPFHWLRGKALTDAEIEKDIEVLRGLLRREWRRSADLIQQLDRARETANAQNEAKSQFLAKMSHELRTPLNAILGYTTLLIENAVEAGDRSASADLDRVQLAGRQLLAVINDILDLIKIDAGANIADRQVISVGNMAQSIADVANVDLQNGNRLELSIAEDVGIMVGDAAKVRQCLLNLLSNAGKFTKDGTIVFAAEHADVSGVPSVVFSIADTGIGIDDEHLEHLFDAFTQVPTHPSQRAGGMGLGLAITRRLARLMGGDCTVETTKGAGSVFRLVLPLSPPAGTRLVSPVSEGSPPDRRRSGGGKCALVVDDDEAALDLMRRWLEAMGYDVLIALDGETGLKVARESRPNVILLDALLPGRSGYEILAELREDPLVGRTPTIIVTVDDDRRRGLACGASDYLRKPLTEESVRAALQVYGTSSAGDILVIDDDDDAADLLRRSVEVVGFSTRRASNGLEGFEMATERPPSAIVLDVRMPKLDGFGLIERLSSAEQLNKVPLIVVSGYDMTLAEHQQLASAGHLVFTKGVVTPREIAQSLRELIA